MKKAVIAGFVSAVVLFLLGYALVINIKQNHQASHGDISQSPDMSNSPTKPATIQNTNTSLKELPEKKVLPTDYHIFQTFNNCGPAALSMTLRFYGIEVSQEELGEQLRPYQHPKGDNDDKSTTLEELALKGEEYGFVTYHRPMGTPEIITNFINYDIPVIARTWLEANDDIGHYRVVKGFDLSRNVFIQDDSFQNKNLEYTYDEFNGIWDKFNFEYLVLVPPELQEVAEEILGEDIDKETAWRKAAQNSLKELQNDPDNVTHRFNLSVAYYHLGQFENSVAEFERVENRLPRRALWYQIEPIQAYYELKNYDRVFEITARVLNDNNLAFSELYLLRGDIYYENGNIEAARAEYEKALLYNKNLKAAQNAVAKVQ